MLISIAQVLLPFWNSCFVIWLSFQPCIFSYFLLQISCIEKYNFISPQIIHMLPPSSVMSFEDVFNVLSFIPFWIDPLIIKNEIIYHSTQIASRIQAIGFSSLVQITSALLFSIGASFVQNWCVNRHPPTTVTFPNIVRSVVKPLGHLEQST